MRQGVLHRMPFGAEPEEDGVRFRLWAPGVSSVELLLGAGQPARSVPMRARGEGWFEVHVPDAAHGSLYRFRPGGGGPAVPDPASRHQPHGVHGPSMVVDGSQEGGGPSGAADAGAAPAWEGRPWQETVIYELHVGTFSPEGTFEGVRRRLDELAELGITAVELMPVAAFSGRRGWGYDGVLPFAPHGPYGTPAELRALVHEAHARGLMVFLDVVYNHFGPDGNYLPSYAPAFFTDRFSTPWGDAIDFSCRPVREFVVHNALYWLEEYGFDGLRLDAVHAIRDESSPDILEELAARVQASFEGRRRVHLILENGSNEARYLERAPDGSPRWYVAQWNDDIHHALHVLATGEREGYYESYADDPARHLCRCLSEGFAYQGEPFGHLGGRRRGEPSAHLPPSAFVAFVQNHDQVGNRAMGERLTTLTEPEAVEALLAVLLLQPQVPLLFMGEEWGAREPFLFFCDFHDELAVAVREGRRREFARFPAFSDPEARERIPDPNAEETFRRSRLGWARRDDPAHAARLALCRELLEIRRRELVPLLGGVSVGASRCRRFGRGGIRARWRLAQGAELTLEANLSAVESLVEEGHGGAGEARDERGACRGRLLWETRAGREESRRHTPAHPLPPWTVRWRLHP